MTLYELLETALTTKQVIADGTLTPVLARSRRGPMRSAIKRYSAFLGIDAETAQPADYQRPEHEIRALMEAKAPSSLAANTRRNLANDIIALLRIGVDQGWLTPLPAALLSWRQLRPHPKYSGVKRREEPINTEPYALHLDECPPALKDAIADYLRWCEAPVVRHRPRAVVKRPITSRNVLGHILQMAGFAVREFRVPTDTLTLEALCQLDVIEAYVNWRIARRGKVTRSIVDALITPATIARYWLKDKKLAQAIYEIRASLPAAEAVHQKDRHWLSLAQLEEVGQSVYPLNARRLQDYPWARTHRSDASGTRTAWYVELSLMIRLLLRLPMRQRCLREMQLDKNLYRDHAGIWQVRFVGGELKVDSVGGSINRYEFPFPAELVPLLDEWLKDWRPRLANPNDAHVFRTSTGRVITNLSYLGHAFSYITYRFTGVSVNPHLIRDIWATEYLNATGDIAGCARRLGNTIEMVMQRYAHILKKDADARANTFMQGVFGNGQTKGTTHSSNL